MSFELPNLDTATFLGIQTQLVRRIPQFTRQWTDFNQSDPGITVLQLLSWLGESLLYQANAIPIETQQNFLRWVLGLPFSDTQWPYATAAKVDCDFPFLELQEVLAKVESGVPLTAERLQAAVLAFLAAPYLALTLADVNALALQTNRVIDEKEKAKPSATEPARVKRADAVVRGEATVVHILSDAVWSYTRPTTAGNTDASAEDGVWRSLLMYQPSADPDAAARLDTLIGTVSTHIAPRVLLGSAVRVAPARLTDINVAAALRCPNEVQPDVVLAAVTSTLQAYFDPTTGGDLGTGWTYDVPPDPQEVQHLIGGVPGVSAIDSFSLTYVPTMRLPDMAWLGANTLLADLPAGAPAMIYAGLPRLRSVTLSARKEAS